MTNRAPLITAVVLLLLSVLYVGSYFALVLPEGQVEDRLIPGALQLYVSRYRSFHVAAPVVFWPLEQIDRKMRPGEWEPWALD